MLDFTLKLYIRLLATLKDQNRAILSFNNFLKGSPAKFIILRQDIDKNPLQALLIAKIQHELDIRSSFYFREFSINKDQRIIREIYDFGHEVGYHYEDLSFAWSKLKAQGSILRQATDGKAGLRGGKRIGKNCNRQFCRKP